MLARIATLVTPDTILRWHRQLIAAKWTFGNQRVGRPGVHAEIRELVLRFARDNATWGYCRIQGALANLGHRVAPTTIRKLLREHGVRPSPERPTSWRTFLRAHWQAIAATDFFTAEVWTATGLRTYYVLFVLELHRRRVHLAGITRNPDDFFMAAAAERSLAFLRGIRFLIADGDTKFSLRFRLVLDAAGTRLIRTPYLAPNANAFAERFVRSIKSECIDRLILFGEEHLRRAVTEYLEHYHRERNHQGLGNELIEADKQPPPAPSSATSASADCFASTGAQAGRCATIERRLRRRWERTARTRFWPGVGPSGLARRNGLPRENGLQSSSLYAHPAGLQSSFPFAHGTRLLQSLFIFTHRTGDCPEGVSGPNLGRAVSRAGPLCHLKTASNGRFYLRTVRAHRAYPLTTV